MNQVSTAVSILLAYFILTACSASGNAPSGQSQSSPLAEINSRVDSSPNRDTSDLDAARVGYKSSPGFYSPTDAKIPHGVRNAGHSVYQIRVLMASSQNSIRQFDISNGQGSALKKKIASLPNSEFDDFEKTVILKEIERCERYKDISDQQTCALTLQMAKGTAFLVGDGQTLWTNFHNVEHYLDLVEKFGGSTKADQIKNDYKLAIYIFDSKGNLVVDPSVVDVHLLVRPQLSRMATSQHTLYAEDSDYVALKLSKSIGTPLKLANRNPKVGESIYNLGYPACTGCSTDKFVTDTPEDFADRAPFPNSNGIDLLVAKGTVVSSTAAQSFLGISDAVAARYNLDRMVFTSADSVGGNSGSPILDEDGRVLGIDAGGKTVSKDGHYERISRGVLPPEFK